MCVASDVYFFRDEISGEGLSKYREICDYPLFRAVKMRPVCLQVTSCSVLL